MISSGSSSGWMYSAQAQFGTIGPSMSSRQGRSPAAAPATIASL